MGAIARLVIEELKQTKRFEELKKRGGNRYPLMYDISDDCTKLLERWDKEFQRILKFATKSNSSGPVWSSSDLLHGAGVIVKWEAPEVTKPRGDPRPKRDKRKRPQH